MSHSVASLSNANLLSDIRDENLSVYRSSPQRLREDVGQESQIAQDYRGRLIYELLQNADDAMDADDGDARICFLLMPDSLWVANSGRPLDDADVRGLCGISASSKGVLGGKRASIGHKGMGFKSVLEISDAPEVYSTTTCFRFSPDDAKRAVQSLIEEGVVQRVGRAPICRFPWALEENAEVWHEFRERGFRTAFRFPLRSRESSEQHSRIAQALTDLPESSLLFLKRLHSVEIVRSLQPPDRVTWRVQRERCGPGAALAPVSSMSESGVYHVNLTNGGDTNYQFLVAYDAEIAIGGNRGSLNEFVWEGVEFTEAAVAARINDGKCIQLPAAWRRLHVFLPSGEPCPYDLLISAAFNSNLSRQEIKIEPTSDGYNLHVVRQIAQLFRDQLAPRLLESGSAVTDVLRLLLRANDLPDTPSTGAAQAVHLAFKAALSDLPLIPAELGPLLSMSGCVVPPLVNDASVGEAFRRVLPADATHEGKPFPVDIFCGGDLARVLVDHGAHALAPGDAAATLADADPQRSRLREHVSGVVSTDPVLSVLEGLWTGIGLSERESFMRKVRQLRLFPVTNVDGNITRVPTQDLQCFYPPRSLKGEVGLSGLCFLLQELCWGALTPTERNQYLAKEMLIWQALFEVREFKFPDVMRASVLPSLDLDSDASDPRRATLRTLDSLAAICQLAGRMPDASKPLPYERLGPNRALFNLSRLDVPCRAQNPDDVKWVPAYRAYLGEDWVGDASFERVSKAIAATEGTPPDVDFVISPSRFLGLRDRFRHLQGVIVEEAEDVGADEVAIDEDEEAALDSDDQSCWLEFFRWLGVNQALRAVHFHDVEDRASGWLKTRTLRKPEGWIFENVRPGRWSAFTTSVVEDAKLRAEMDANPEAQPYFYQLHDLEHLTYLIDFAARDATSVVGGALYEHLARNWNSLQRFCQLEVALVPGEPKRRTKPPRAYEDEIVTLEESNFWLHRLRGAAVCPTGHGPRTPAEVWFPTQEVLRRFGRKIREGVTSYLLPTLDLPMPLLKGRAKGLTQAMGIREELSPASFTEMDALVVLRRLQSVYGARVADGDELRQELREVIRPAYRHILELLSDRVASAGSGLLKDAPVLAYDGLGRLNFRTASNVFYVERRDTRDRLRLDSALWTFVLEAHQAGRSALVELFGCRSLEDSLEWSPQVGDAALPEAEIASWRLHLQNLAPYVLARVGADRSDETQSRRDASRLRSLIMALEPVVNLRLACSLDGQPLSTGAIDREAFVDIQDRQSDRRVAFVRWGEGVWPPTEDDAEALSTAFGEVLGPGYFESFLALIRAPSDAKRKELLKRAGAPTDIDERRLLFFATDDAHSGAEHDKEQQGTAESKTITTEPDTELPAQHPTQAQRDGEQPKQVPLYSLAQITVNGMPLTLIGDATVAHRRQGPHIGSQSRDETNADPDDPNNGGYGGHTDMELLNSLGMAITLTYEVARLRRAGATAATAFDVGSSQEQANALVFDVSTPASISKARSTCGHFDRAFRKLVEVHNIPAEWPGFDVLTLGPTVSDEVDRIIELKSSGISSRVQGMSWNEWKSARSNLLRNRFYLYLVGNLRSDLKGTSPFIRTIRDPFEQLNADVQVNKRVERRVQLAVHLFREAEHLDLTVLEQHGGRS